MKTITIILTKYTDILSKFIYLITGFGYTHVSLSLDETYNEFYSFNYKGFCIETIQKHRKRGVKKSMCYQLQVTDTAHEKLDNRLKEFIKHKAEFRYSKVGVFFCILRVPFKWKKHYFCSQFVAELLLESGAVDLRKKPCLYLPNHFKSELEETGRILRVQYDIV